MLEFLFLRWFYKWLAKTAEAKHRTRAWGWLGVVGWIGGELTGFVLSGSTDSSGYVAALGGGALGAGLAAVVVSLLSTPPDPDFPSARVV
jgi:hypothetical protein